MACSESPSGAYLAKYAAFAHRLLAAMVLSMFEQQPVVPPVDPVIGGQAGFEEAADLPVVAEPVPYAVEETARVGVNHE